MYIVWKDKRAGNIDQNSIKWFSPVIMSDGWVHETGKK